MPRYIDVVFNIPVNRAFTYAVEDGAVCAVGQRVKAPFRGRKLTGFVIGGSQGPPEGGYRVKPVEKITDDAPVFGELELDLADWLSRLYFCSKGEALSVILPGGIKKSRIQEELIESELPGGELTLSEEQRRAVDRICSGDSKLFYLHGLTGSGKTEVYLSAAEHALARGRGVIYLVPEIALTHQITDHVRKRFGERTAVLHSRLTASQRMEEWKRIRSGEAVFAIGARSAVFAPVADLGLVIIDEEHESSYKSGSHPRYHARQVAMYRASREKAALVMGSATPSLEAYHLMQEGKIEAIPLTKRLAGGKMPSLGIVDLKHEENSISKVLAGKIDTALADGKQVILFLNRRGFSYFFHCRTCGFEMTCSHCSVSLTYHKQHNRMICHYCGFSTPPVSVCPECGSLDVGYSGFGTEKIEEDVSRLFPEARTARIDTDSVQKRGALKSILTRFSAGEIDILLGTQMVAKGLNFPKVDLVGIVLADTGLSLPDFRAAERTFQLLQQVSGRAGRFSREGEVIIQTFRPGNIAIQSALKGDLEGFYTGELEIRKALRFPPFGRLFRLVFRGRGLEETAAAADRVGTMLTEALGELGEVLGPAACPIGIIAKNHRYQIIIRTDRFSRTHAVLKQVLNSYAAPSKVYIEIDVDPVSLL